MKSPLTQTPSPAKSDQKECGAHSCGPHPGGPHPGGRRYSPLAVRLHWIVALLVALQFLLKGAMVSTMNAIRADQTPAIADYLLANVHVLSGLSIGGLMLWRLHLRLLNMRQPRNPGQMEDDASGQRRQPAPGQSGDLSRTVRLQVVFRPLASVVHWAFYGLLLLLPLTGLLAYYEVSLAASAHRVCQRLLLALLFMHILAALVHHFIFRDDALARITGKA